MKIINRKGFTLIEIMLVVAIIGILAAMVVPRLTGRTKDTKISVAKADVEVNIPLVLDIYELDMGDFPEKLEDLLDNPGSSKNWKGPYLKKLPKDPWGHNYLYKNPGDKSRYGCDVYSAGPDEQAGTDDDIGNWDAEK
ncbi:MAG: type II secretion system major pseudopilin GspG [Candidatus Omnitrophica bacterium]|nr:type II secretion system major pseudopilin GspG [Candidatus Omnitrophota bacterium]